MKTIVVSDIHGDLNQLMYPLMLYLSNPNEYKLVILGDYIDRGESNVYIYEIIRVIHKFKNVHALFGNHELYDKGTIDYISYRSPKRVKTYSYIKSFVYDLFYNMDLDIVYYEKETKILYSHSPLNRPLSIVLKLPKSEDSTYTYDIGSANMEYKNIHGHDHKRSTKSEIKSFFNGNDINMISIDNDSSYGMQVMQNAMSIGCECRDWVNDTESNVLYLIIDNDDIRNYEIQEKRIPYGSNNDYNNVSFMNIKQTLIETCKDKSLLKELSMLSLDTSYNKFRKDFKYIDNAPKIIRDRYNFIMNKHSDDQSANVYYHDIPFEYYQQMLKNSNKPSKELKDLVIDHEWINIHDLYWVYVLGDKVSKMNHKETLVPSLTGGNKLDILVYILISLTVLMILVSIGITITITIRKRKASMNH